MEPVTPNGPVKVGEYYWVNCASLISPDGIIRYSVPIIGEVHKDLQFGIGFKHYHIDGRFSNNFAPMRENGRTNHIVPVEHAIGAPWKVHEITKKIKRCVSETTGLLMPGAQETFNNWQQTFIGKSCSGKRCPHLGTEMNEIKGKLVCPLHNLQGCKEKEIIIPYEEQYSFFSKQNN